MRGSFPITMVTVLALSMLSSMGSASADEELERARAAAGEVLFQHNCRACHSPDSADNTFGPSLINVIGREAGSLPRFAYSDAVKESGIIWSEDNLRAWMTDNEAFIPGTRMRHVKITDEAAQDFILAFIKSMEQH